MAVFDCRGFALKIARHFRASTQPGFGCSAPTIRACIQWKSLRLARRLPIHRLNPAMPRIPHTVQEQLRRGLALHQGGRLEEARALYEAALRLQPANPAALHFLGLLAVAEGRIAEGIGRYQASLRVEPASAVVWSNLGNALLAAGRADEAVAAQRRAIEVEPGLAEAHCNLGNALHAQGRWDEAAAVLSRAIALKPALAEAHNNLGNTLKSQGHPEDAIAAYRRALVIRPNYTDAWCNLGHALLLQGLPAEAEKAYSRALALAPNHPEALNNRGQALRELGRLDEALEACTKAISVKPGYAGALANLGNALVALNRLDAASKAYQEALRLMPDSAEIAYNACLVHLVQGEMASAWDGYELRWRLGNLRHRPVQNRPAWDGAEPLAGRSIVVYAEQGLGDTLQFARYIPLLADRGATVRVVVQKSLKSLVESVRGAVSVTTSEQSWPQCDLHCPLLSLPRAFGTTLATVPAAAPYIAATRDRREAAREWLASVASPRVGVVWAGNPSHPNDRNRSLPMAALAPVLAASLPRWVSLQKELRPGELEALHAAGGVDLSGHLGDFDDTAGVLALLDLVITVDTSVAHLAGAMGIPTWILLPFAPDWRWLLDRDDSPWYPTARLFRQTEPGSWDGALARVAAELEKWTTSKKAVGAPDR
jgi:tetratricopeptide (TPR) repeat protein